MQRRTVIIILVTLVLVFVAAAIGLIAYFVVSNNKSTPTYVPPGPDPDPGPDPGPGSSFVTAVWSGGMTDWQDLLGKVDYIFLATALPQDMTTDINKDYGGAFQYIDKTPATDFVPSQIGNQKLLLSIGGSNASIAGWLGMAQKPLQDWVSYFLALKAEFGIGGIDWDIEPDTLYAEGADTTTVCTFFGELSRALKKADPMYQVSVTVFGNATKYTKGKAVAAFMENYIDAIDVIPIMLYNSGMWRDDTYGSWCTYADGFFSLFSSAVAAKTLYAIWMASQSTSNADCCGSCIAEVLSKVSSGVGQGIAFWCYGGYTGACGTPAFKPVTLAVLDQLQKTGLQTTEEQLQTLILANAPYATNPEYCLSNGCGKK